MASSSIRDMLYSESIEMPILTADNPAQIFFPDNAYIRNVKLMAIDIWTNLNEFNGGAQQRSIKNKLIINTPLAAFIYITLESYSGVQFVRRMPISKFLAYFQQTQGNNSIERFVGQRVNWPKSYLEIAPGAPLPASNSSLLFDIHFTKIKRATVMSNLAVEFKKKK